MKFFKILFPLLAFTIASCAPSRFYVKNKTNKDINFVVLINASARETYRTVKLTVRKDQSVLVRKTRVMGKSGTLHDVFYKIQFEPQDSVKQNPNDFKNWAKSENEWGKPIYIFTATR